MLRRELRADLDKAEQAQARADRGRRGRVAAGPRPRVRRAATPHAAGERLLLAPTVHRDRTGPDYFRKKLEVVWKGGRRRLACATTV